MSDSEDPWEVYYQSFEKDSPSTQLDLIDETLDEIPEEIPSFPPQNKKAKSMVELLNSDNGIPVGWEEFFKKFLPLINRFDSIERQCREICFPRIWERFRAFHLLPTQYVRVKQFEDGIETEVLIKAPLVKVVIIGQDPYTTTKAGIPTAMGMSFSVRNGHTINPSLRNIFLRMKETGVISRTPMSGNLEPLAQQGVFFLNMALTVPNKEQWSANNPGKKYVTGMHVRPWRGFIEAVVEYLAETNPNCVYLLWGRHAQGLETILPSSSERFSCSHPMPLAYTRAKDGFNTMDHFNQANQVLIESGIDPVDWDVLQ